MALTNNVVLWGIRFTETTYQLRVTANATQEDLTFPASGSLSPTTDYYMNTGGGGTDLAAILDTCLESHTQVTSSSTTFDANWDLSTVLVLVGGTAKMEWSDTTNTTLAAAIYGYTTAADSDDATTIVSPNQPKGVWRPHRPASIDTRERQPVVGGVSEAVSGKVRVSRIADPEKLRTLGWMNLPKERVLDEYASTNAGFEMAWVESISKGYGYRFFEDEDGSPIGGSVYRIRDLVDPAKRSEEFQLYWDVILRGRVST